MPKLPTVQGEQIRVSEKVFRFKQLFCYNNGVDPSGRTLCSFIRRDFYFMDSDRTKAKSPNLRLPYRKPVLTIDEQADRLLQRGLQGDRRKLLDILRYVNYYRFTGFLFPFKQNDGETFRAGTTVDGVWALYTFDRRLRGLLFECIGRLEIAFRTQFAYEHARVTNDPFCHLDPQNFDLGPGEPGQRARRDFHQDYADMVKRICGAENKATGRLFFDHFKRTYSDEHLPIWMVFELVEFGVLPHYFEMLPKTLRIQIANGYGVTDRTFRTWLMAINNLRNRCAHHERLVYSLLQTQNLCKYCSAKQNPRLLHLEEALEGITTPNGTSLYVIIAIMVHLLSIIRPESRWLERFRQFMLNEENRIGRQALTTFCDERWLTCALWQSAI